MAGRDMQAFDFGQSQPAVIDQNSIWFDHLSSRARPKATAAVAPKAKGNSLLKTLLSISGGVAGGAIGTLIAPGVGTAIGAGLGSGLGTAAGRLGGGEELFDDGGAQEIALDTVLGGAFGGAGKAAKAAARTGGVVAKGATKAAQEGAETAGRKGLAEALSGMRGTGEDLVGAATGIKYGAKPLGKEALGRSGAATLQDTVRSQGIKMTSPRATARGVEKAMTDVGGQLDDIFRTVKQPIGQSDVVDLQRRFLAEIDSPATTLSKDDSAVKGLLGKLQGTKFSTTDDILQFKRTTGAAFQRNASSMKPKNAEAQQIMNRVLNNFLVERAPQSATTNALFGQLAQADDLMKAGARGVQGKGLNIGGNVVGSGPIAGIKNRAGNAMIDLVDAATAGGAVRKATAGGMVKPLVARQAGREFLTGGFSADIPEVDPTMTDPTMQEDAPAIGYTVGQDGTIEPLTADASMGGMGDMGGDPTSGIRQQLQQAMLDDLQLTGGKNVSALKTVLSTLEPEKESVSSKNAAKKLSQALGTVDTLQQQFESAGGGQSYGGYGASLLGALKMNPQAGAYNDMRGGFLSQVSKALGESGVLTDQDIARVRNLVPDLADNPEQAAIKWQALRQVLSGSMGTPSAVGSDTRFNNQEVY